MNRSKTYNYLVKIHFSPEDQAYIVEVPGLPGCMADGSTEEEALANADVIIGEWIQTAKSLNRHIPEPEPVSPKRVF